MAATASAGKVYVEIGVDIGRLPSQLSRAESLLAGTGTRMYFLGNRITSAIALPIVGAVGAIAKFGLAFDKSMTESLAIIKHVTPQMRKEMEQVAKDLTKTTKFSADEGAKAYFELASAGLDAQQSMKALPVVAQFAQAGVMDLATATRYLTTSQNMMGLSSKDAEENMKNMTRIADVLTEANNLGIGTVEDYAKALTNTRGKLRELNKTTEEGTAILMAYASVGRLGAVAGTQLYMVLRDLQKGAASNSAGWKTLGVDVYDSNRNMRKFSDILADLEGKMAGMSDEQEYATLKMLGFTDRSRGAMTTIFGLSGAIRDWEMTLLQAGGTTERVAGRQMLALQNRLLSLWNQIKVQFINVWEQFGDVIETRVIPALQDFIDWLEDCAKTLKEMSEPQKEFIAFLLSVPVVLGPAIVVLGGFMLTLKGLLGPFNALIKLWAAWRVAGAMTNKQITFASPAMVAIVDKTGRALRAFEVNAGGAIPPASKLHTTLALMSRSAFAVIKPLGLITLAILGAGGLAYAMLRLAGLSDEASERLKELGKSVIKGVADTVTETGKGIGRFVSDTGDFLSFWVEVAKYVGALAPDLQLVVMLVEKLSKIKPQTVSGAIKYALGNAIPPVGALMQYQGTPYWGGAAQILAEARGKGRPEVKFPGIPQMPGFLAKEFPMPPLKEWGPFDDEELNERLEESQRKIDQFLEKVKELRDGFRGLGGEDLKVLVTAWDGLTNSEQSNINILTRVWEAYSKIRDQLDPSQYPADLERATAQNVEFVRSLNAMAEQELWDRLIDPLGRLSSEAQEWLNYAGMISMEFSRMSVQGEDTGEFFRAHADTIDELVQMYDSLPPSMQEALNKFTKLLPIMEKYQRWRLAASEASPEHKKALNDANDFLGDSLDKANAMLKDKMSERLLFSKSYVDQELAGIRTGLAERARVFEENEKEALKQLTMFADAKHRVEFFAGLQRFKDLKNAHALILAEEKRIGLLRLAQSVGFTARMIRNAYKLTDEELKLLIKRYVAYQEYFDKIRDLVEFQSLGAQLVSALGFDTVGEALAGVAAGIEQMWAGTEKIVKAENFTQTMSGWLELAIGTINALKAMRDGMEAIESQGGRMAFGAYTGAQIGGNIVPGWGHLIGGIAGAIWGGATTPNWTKVKRDLVGQWNVGVSDTLAKVIDEDAKKFGGNWESAMMHIADIAKEYGGVTADSVEMWAYRTRTAFNMVAMGWMTTAHAAEAIDSIFGDLVKSGTNVNGVLNAQVRELVLLERQYRTGSAAIAEYVRAQLGGAGAGFGAVGGGLYKHANDLFEEIAELRKKTEDPGIEREEGEELDQLMKQIADKTKEMNDLLAGGQDQFDRLGRIAMGTFAAMLKSGIPMLEIIEIMGPGLDAMSKAMKNFGYTATGAFADLLGFRDFVREHPELAEAVTGLNNMLTGLANTGFMTAGMFKDLGRTAVDLYNQLIKEGMSGTNALILMQPALQTLWQLQKDFGYEVDDSTQALIDQAVASGIVGEAHRGAMDRIASAVERLVEIFERVFAEELVDAADEAKQAVEGIGTAIDNLPSDVNIDFHVNTDGPDVPQYGRGAYVDTPHLAVVGDRPEYIIPADQINRVGGGNRPMVVQMIVDGRQIAEASVPYIPGVVKRFGLVK